MRATNWTAIALTLAAALWTFAVMTFMSPAGASLDPLPHWSPELEEFSRLRPTVSQESIEEALKRFAIQIPKSVRGPELDAELVDRGLTIRENWWDEPLVKIGPTAFSSWALLGSTLAHELEVHCNQSFARIAAEERLGIDGTGRAEREAYTYELVNHRRFGLSSMERRLIMDTMDRFYPADGSERNPAFAALRFGLSSLLMR